MDEPELMKRLRAIDTESMTPMQALMLLDNLKQEFVSSNG
jgi:hypothetical protein